MKDLVLLALVSTLGVGMYLLYQDHTGTKILPAEFDVIRSRYVCAEGRSFTTYKKGSRIVLELSDSKPSVHKLSPVLPKIPGAGERFANSDETIIFYLKGASAAVQEDNTTTYRSCSVH